MEIAPIVAALNGRKEGVGWRCECPVHGGHHLSVGVGRSGTVVFKCHQGASQDDVISGLTDRGLWGGQELPGPTNKAPVGGMIQEAEYEYRNEAGELVAVKARFRRPDGSKTFLWRLPEDTKWGGLKGMGGADIPLYGSELVALHEGPVWIVEGEKAANACRAAGLVALCPYAGASTKEFGQGLRALDGRDVILWPDNDPPGRELMERLKRLLSGAESVRVVIPPGLPDHADAWDYFNTFGGSPDALTVLLASMKDRPWVEESPNGYMVTLPEGGGYVRFLFDHPQAGKSHAIDCAMTVWQEIPGTSRERWIGRLNIMSNSARTELRRQLDEMFGKEGNWTSRLNRAVAMVQQVINEADPSFPLAHAVNPGVTGYVLRPLAVAGPSILFGRGGSSKTYLALAIAVAVSSGEPLMGFHSNITGPVLFIDYESDAYTLLERVRRIAAGLSIEEPGKLPIRYWPGRGIPLYEQAESIRQVAARDACRLVIVDSAGLAAGGEPEKAEFALRYFGALQTIGIPSLTISHVTKGDEDVYPFGSVYWHNSARATWSIKLSQDATNDDGVAHVGLFNRKSNDDRLQPPIGVRVTFEHDPPVIRFDTEEVSGEFSRSLSLAARLTRELSGGSRSIKELADALHVGQEQIRARLSGMEGVTRLARHSDGTHLWGLKG